MPFAIDAYRNLCTTATWLLEPFLPIGGSALLYSPPKAGKSWLALGLSFAVAKGEAWLGYPTVQGTVLYVQIDTPRSLQQLNLFQRAEAAGVDLPESHWFITDSEVLPFPFNILEPAHARALRAEVEAAQPALVIIDTLRKAFRGNENDNDILTAVTDTFKVICRPAAVLYIHHAKKAPADGLTEYTLMDEIRGTSATSGAVDTIMRLRDKKALRGELTIQGRAVEETTIPLERQPSLLWALPNDPFKVAVATTLTDPRFTNDTDRARHLSMLSGKSIPACRRALQRAAEHAERSHT